MGYSRIVVILMIGFVAFSCERRKAGEVPVTVKATIDSLRYIYAPDKRVARFQIEASVDGQKLTFEGESDQPEAVEMLLTAPSLASWSINNKIHMLPDESADSTPYAIVNNSVSNFRSRGRHSAELATQAILGTVVKVLRVTKEWYLVQTPDDYIAWVDHGGVVLMDEAEITDWLEADKVIVTAINATVYDSTLPDRVVSDVVVGNILKEIGREGSEILVEFPDGRTGRLSIDAVESYTEWLAGLNPTADLVEQYARQLMGVPYLWGGTSAKGMDCSGFTKTVYFMNGMVIPRDASQQVNAGKAVDENLAFDDLEKGDLLFFGKPATDSTRQRTTHVGIWLGNKEFIHASKRVRISSIDPTSPLYDEFNKNRYLGSRRYLNNVVGNIENLKTTITQR